MQWYSAGNMVLYRWVLKGCPLPGYTQNQNATTPLDLHTMAVKGGAAVQRTLKRVLDHYAPVMLSPSGICHVVAAEH
jgi:argininosuccinate lyase